MAIFNMILPRPTPPPEVVVEHIITTVPTGTIHSVVFSGVEEVPTFFIMVKTGDSNTYPFAWTIGENGAVTTGYMTSTSSSSNITARYETTQERLTVNYSSANETLTFGLTSALYLGQTTFHLFYTTQPLQRKTVTLSSAFATLDFTDVTADDTSKILILVQTASFVSATNRPAYWIRNGSDTALQARAYSSSSNSNVSIRTINSGQNITESYPSGLRFTRGSNFPVGDYTIYYA